MSDTPEKPLTALLGTPAGATGVNAPPEQPGATLASALMLLRLAGCVLNN